MEFRLKLVTSVAAVGLLAGLPACGPGGEAGEGGGQTALLGEGGEGGEGGEAGGLVGLTPDQAHLARVALMQGHITAGNTLIDLGETEVGKAHATHPLSEIYEPNRDAFEERGLSALEDALQAYAQRLEEMPPPEVLEAARAEVARQLEAAAAVGTVSDHAEALSELMSEVAGEYAIGVVDGEIAVVHEYQDAWGFLRAGAAQFEARRADYEAADAEATAELAAALDAALAAFPDVVTDAPPPLATIRAATTQVALALYPFRGA